MEERRFASERDLLVLGEAKRPAPVLIHEGKVTAEWEPDSGWLRNICYDGVEVVRAIYGAVRAPDWGTFTPEPYRTFETMEGSRRVIGFEQTANGFTWTTTIFASEEQLVVVFAGQADRDVETNRIGLLLLHPHTFAGHPCLVDGIPSTFPHRVAPHEPFINHHSIEAFGCRADFGGDTFSTEDQRNWSDASYKTYPNQSRPSRPFLVPRGEQIGHTIILHFSDATREPANSEPAPIWTPLPSIGVTSSDGSFPNGSAHVAVPDGDSMRLIFRDGTILKPDIMSSSHFTDINRNHPDWVEHAMFATNPQAHAFDWKTIVEAIDGQEACALTCKEFAENVHVGPITLDGNDEDPRWNSLFAAGWLLASACRLARTGVATLTYSGRGAGNPVSQILGDLSEFAGGEALYVAQAHISLRKGDRSSHLYANLTDEPQITTFPAGRMRVLDETNIHLLASNPKAWRDSWLTFEGGSVEVPPHGYVRIEGTPNRAQHQASLH